MRDEPAEAANENTIDINPRSVEEVCLQAVALISLVRRAILEAQTEPDQKTAVHVSIETDRFELYSWVRRELLELIGDREIAIFRTEAGSLRSDQVDDCMDALIAAEPLCWALSLMEQLDDPAEPGQDSIDRMLEWALQPWESPGARAERDHLRSDEVLARERERRELWYWRSSLRAADFASSEQMKAAIIETAEEAQGADLIGVSDGDFDFKGQPTSSLTSEQIAEIQHISEVQLRALNWVCGFGASWESVPVYPD